MNYSPSTISRIADINYGLRVDTGSVLGPALSTANPTLLTLFNVVGGRVLVRQIIAEATETFVGVGALIKLAFTPTGGAQVDLTAVSLDAGSGAWAAGIRLILGAAIGGTTTFSAIGASVAKAADPYVLGQAGGVGGAILSHATTAAFTDGTAVFSLWYVPLDDGAYIEAAV
jgi:hypothetical protein